MNYTMIPEIKLQKIVFPNYLKIWSLAMEKSEYNQGKEKGNI